MTQPNQPNQPNQTVPPTYMQSNISINNLIDLTINNLIVQKFSSALMNFEFSRKYFSSFIMLLILSEFKTISKRCLEILRSLIKQNPMVAIKYVYDKCQKLALVSNERTIEHNDPEPEILYIEANQVFILQMYHFVKKNCRYYEEFIGVQTDNSKDIVNIINISNIQYNNIRLHCTLCYHIDVLRGTPISVLLNSAMICRTPKPVENPKSLSDLLTDSERLMIKRLQEYDTRFTKKSYLSGQFDKSFDRDFASQICKYYPQFDFNDTMYVFSMVRYIHMVSMSNTGEATRAARTALNNLLEKGKLTIDLDHTYNKSINVSPVSYYEYLGATTALTALIYDKYTKTLEKISAYIRPLLFSTKTDNNDSKIYVSAIDDTTISQLKTDINEFVKEVYGTISNTSTTIKIFNLTLEKQVETVEKDNPEYESWLEAKSSIDEISKMSANSNTPAALAITLSAGDLRPPPKKITIENVKHIVMISSLNEVCKNIDTLYLRKIDMRKIVTSLTQFRDNKEMIKQFGLQNKLNILLYGMPGTGKSTTIQVIATFLGKDIYYVDLKNAKTNKDLHMIFEYVNKNVPNGGIIVIEDIDAMCSVVLQRVNPISKRDKTVNAIVSDTDSELSLEYLLNILQGTLTLEDSIVIVTTNHIDHLDKAFYRDGRFDIKVELKMCDHYQISTIYKKFIGRKIPPELLKKIPEDKYTPAEIIFHVKDYVFNKTVEDEVILNKFMSVSI